MFFCDKCSKQIFGDFINCDECTKSFQKTCANSISNNDIIWQCPSCIHQESVFTKKDNLQTIKSSKKSLLPIHDSHHFLRSQTKNNTKLPATSIKSHVVKNIKPTVTVTKPQIKRNTKSTDTTIKHHIADMNSFNAIIDERFENLNQQTILHLSSIESRIYKIENFIQHNPANISSQTISSISETNKHNEHSTPNSSSFSLSGTEYDVFNVNTKNQSQRDNSVSPENKEKYSDQRFIYLNDKLLAIENLIEANQLKCEKTT